MEIPSWIAGGQMCISNNLKIKIVQINACIKMGGISGGILGEIIKLNKVRDLQIMRKLSTDKND